MKNSSKSRISEGMPWVLRTVHLETGDVILSTQPKDPVSWSIRFVTDSIISHAAIYVGGGFLVEAVREGVRLVHSRRFLFPSRQQVRVLRHKTATETILQDAAAHAKALVYRPYSVKKALSSLFSFTFPDSEGRFCSELVAESFRRTVKPLAVSGNPEKITPAQLLECTDFSDQTDDLRNR
ncbi:MAG: YiiX/YebB-like N1pC/P60 family cysteine hydrolase [Verrucomicrobia bacterium]|nr:YiiX/YebB-like N1pC/P60 family cysteine hydrolase [Verrucomicrobiota bacterium]